MLAAVVVQAQGLTRLHGSGDTAIRSGRGAVLMLNPLLYAREMGCPIGVLQSCEMGFKVYERIRFRHICQVKCFYLSHGKPASRSQA